MPDITFTPFNNYLHSQEQGTPFVISVVTNAAATSISPVVTSQLPPPPPPPTTSGGFDNLNYYSTAYVSLDNKRSRVTTLTTKGLDDEDSAAIREIKLKVFDVAGTDSNVYFKVDETALSGSFDTFKIVHGDNETDVLSSTVSNGKIYFNLPRMLEDTTDYTLKYKTKTNVVAGIASFTDKEIDLVSFYENTEIDTVLFTFTATTTDGAEFTTGATYTFVSGNEAGHFEIDGNQVKTTSIPVNYETPTVSITLRIKGSMGGAEVDHDFTVIVNNRNESPTAIAFTKVTGLNTDHTGSIGTLSTTDPDAGDTHTYEISGTDKFVITNSNEVHVAEGATLVAGTLYGFTIKSTDVEQLSVTVDTFSYTFSSVNAAPTEITFTEETGLNTDHTGSVGTLATTDADDGDSHTYTLTTTGGAAHATLEIKNANEVHVKSGVTLTADTPYTFKITTNDGNGGTYSDDTFSVTFSAVGGGGGGDLTQTISLNAGWNLISFYVDLNNAAPSVVFSELISNSNLKFVSKYAGGYTSYDQSNVDMGMGFLNSLSNISYEYGYWVQTNTSQTFSVTGATLSGPLQLNSGWNLVSYYVENEVDVTTAFSTLISNGNLKFVSKYAGGYTSYDQSNVDMGMGFLNSLTGLSPGFGYWVLLNNAVTDFYY